MRSSAVSSARRWPRPAPTPFSGATSRVKVLVPLVSSPILGFVIGLTLMVVLLNAIGWMNPRHAAAPSDGGEPQRRRIRGRTAAPDKPTEPDR